jgi:DNA-binding NarL/FixJ family response regulator
MNSTPSTPERSPSLPPPLPVLNRRRAFRVMLVDDHAIVRTGYRRLLELEGDMQVVAEQGQADQAYEQLGRLLPGGLDVLVLDLSLPQSSGLALLEQVHQRWPLLQVLVFSMHDNPAMVRQALKAGAAGYVTKSSEPDALVRALRRVALGERQVLSQDIEASAVRPPAAAPHLELSPREFDVLRGLVQGLSLEEIAQRLHIAPKTVSNLQSQLRQRLGVGTAIELLRYAQQHGLADELPPPVPG